jgi:DNA-directed RNA polymerase sigma subunit (sigma70/sigma32)
VLDSKESFSIEYQDETQSRNVFFKQLLKTNHILNKKESKIVFDIFIAEKTLSEVGRELLMSPEGVRKIKNKAILKLKNCI